SNDVLSHRFLGALDRWCDLMRHVKGISKGFYPWLAGVTHIRLLLLFVAESITAFPDKVRCLRVANNSRILTNRATTYGKRSVVSDSSSGANPDNNHYMAELELAVGNIVQELGWDEDTDFEFRNGLEDALGEDFLTEEDQEPVDAVLLWWREDDGDVTDLTDALVDAT